MPATRFHRIFAIAATAAMSMAGVACGEDTAATDDGAGDQALSVTVTASDFAFEPSSVSVASAGTVRLTLQNEDDTQHSITIEQADFEIVADGGSSATGDLAMEDGASLHFHCMFHSSMTGVIAVGDAAGAGGGATPPPATADPYDY